MEVWQNWALFAALVAGVASYYYTLSGKSKRVRGRAAAILADKDQQRASGSRTDSSNDARKKKGKGKTSDASDQAASDAADVSSASVQTSPSERAKKRNDGKQQPSKLAQSSAVEVSKEREVHGDMEDEVDEGISNADMAKKLSQLKAGTSLQKPVATKDIKKIRKQGKHNELPPAAPNGSSLGVNGTASAQDMSTASSTTGADADDDLSLPVSPEFGATQATTPSGLDVSDMLEPPAKGPAILRLTQPVNPQPVRKPKDKKAVPEPETKKQRQNRQKNEEKKAMHDQAEKERRVLLEKQRRTAREAEGRPAKNGTGISKQLSSNAWSSTAGAATEVITPSPLSTNEPLLDTFEEDTSNAKPSARGITSPRNGMSVDDKAWNRDIPSEEEQLKLIDEMDDDKAWNTVPSGKGKKKSGTAGTVTGSVVAGAHKAESSGSKKPLFNNSAPSFTHTQTPNYNNKDITSSSQAKTPTANSNAVVSSVAAMSLDKMDAPSPMIGWDGKPIVRTPGMSEEEYGMLFREYEDYLENWKKTQWSDGRLKAQNPANPIKVGTKTTSTGRKRAIMKRPRRPKANEETLDHDVWNLSNIKEHPDYDPDWPYALVPHPCDSDFGSGGK